VVGKKINQVGFNRVTIRLHN